jgi:DNA-binding transcriptional ArsR family regulator
VLPRSRETSRSVGPLAWVVLEELALRTQCCSEAVVETNVRALASDLGVGKDTVAQALARLIDLGLVRCHAQRRAGRYTGSAYELDVETCRHVGLVLDGLTSDDIPVPDSPCPVQPDPAQRDAITPDTVGSAPAESTTPTPARPLPQSGSQSLFDLSDEPSPSLTVQPNDPPALTPRPPSSSPSSPRPEPAPPSSLRSSLTRSNRPDALAPGVRPSAINASGSAVNGAAAFNGNLNEEAEPC